MNDEKKTCCCGCSQRKKERTPEEYTRLIHRLNRICVVEDIRGGKDEVIDELVATLQKLMK